MSPTNEWPPANPHVPYIVPMTADRPVADREPLSDPREREHTEERPGVRSWWRCVPIDVARQWEHDAARAHPDEAGLREALTPDYCDCDYEPVRGIKAGRHLPSCRYGIIEDFLGTIPAQPAVPVAGAEDMETCPTCWQPVPRPQRGDHDYGIPLRAAQPEDDGLDVDRLALAFGNRFQGNVGELESATWAEIAEQVAAEYRRLSDEGVERRDGA